MYTLNIKNQLSSTTTIPRDSGRIETMKKPNLFKSKKEWEEFVWEKIVAELVSSKSSKDINIFLARIIGDYEKKLIIRRLTLALLVQEGLSYSQIGELLWLSPTTISTIKKNLSNSSESYKSRRNFPNQPKKYSPKKLPSSFKSEDPSFAQLLKEIVSNIHFQSGYTNIKERWKFLRDY